MQPELCCRQNAAVQLQAVDLKARFVVALQGVELRWLPQDSRLTVATVSSAAPHRRSHAISPCDAQPPRLKNCTARSCFSAAARVRNVPRLRRLPVFGFFLRE